MGSPASPALCLMVIAVAEQIWANTHPTSGPRSFEDTLLLRYVDVVRAFLPVSLAAKSATLAALERLEKARKELDEASRELLVALNLQGSATDSL